MRRVASHGGATAAVADLEVMRRVSAAASDEAQPSGRGNDFILSLDSVQKPFSCTGFCDDMDVSNLTWHPVVTTLAPSLPLSYFPARSLAL